MAHDEALAERVRELLAPDGPFDERRMFGGLAFLVGGHMAVAASGQGGLLVRVDPAELAAIAAEPDVAPMEMRGRPLKGWVHVEPGALGTRRQLARWVGRGVAQARRQPPKAPAPR